MLFYSKLQKKVVDILQTWQLRISSRRCYHIEFLGVGGSSTHNEKINIFSTRFQSGTQSFGTMDLVRPETILSFYEILVK